MIDNTEKAKEIINTTLEDFHEGDYEKAVIKIKGILDELLKSVTEPAPVHFKIYTVNGGYECDCEQGKSIEVLGKGKVEPFLELGVPEKGTIAVIVNPYKFKGYQKP